ncbi:MAG: GTP 3',8-cyclase MoaA [Gemmatimonadaceae bacterium]
MTAARRDQFGRSIEYLRISVTDKCNFRCLYCMPVEGLQWLPKSEILSYEEIASIASQLAQEGISRLRITGGEPTIRPNLDVLFRMLRSIDGITDIALSTNGVRLPELAALYRESGLDRINMSVDSLRPGRIAAISRRPLRFDPLESAAAAEKAGLSPIKINMVVMRGINDDEIEDFARLTLDHPWHVRFIELMPVGSMNEVTWEHVVPSAEILDRIAAVSPLRPSDGPALGNGPARYYQLDDGPGSIGVITPMTHTYCATCNRVRLTADGRLRTCLFGDHEVDLRNPLRDGMPVGPLFRQALAEKPEAHALLQLQVGGLKALSQVGG